MLKTIIIKYYYCKTLIIYLKKILKRVIKKKRSNS